MPILPHNKRIHTQVLETMECSGSFGRPWLSPGEVSTQANNLWVTDKPLPFRKVASALCRFEDDYRIAETARFRLAAGASSTDYDSWVGPFDTNGSVLPDPQFNGTRTCIRYRLVEPPSIDGEVAELMRKYPAPERTFSEVVLGGLGILPPHAPADTA